MPEPSAVSKTKLRIENLSDLVFGLALSIGSIVLISNLPQTPSELVTGILLFGASFLLIVWIWTGYTATMEVLPYEVRGTFLLNIMLLFCVAVQPYLFYVLSEGQNSLLEFSSSVYALDVGAMLFIMAGLVRIFLTEEKKTVSHTLPPVRLMRFRRSMISLTTGGVAFILSAAPTFWIPTPAGDFLRFDVWYVALAAIFVAPRVGGRAPTSS